MNGIEVARFERPSTEFKPESNFYRVVGGKESLFFHPDDREAFLDDWTGGPRPDTSGPGLWGAFEPFCFSCGVLASPTGDAPCGHPQDSLLWQADQIGTVLEFGKPAVVVEAGSRPVVVYPNGRSKATTRDRLQKARVILDMSTVPSALFRLETVAARPERWATGVRKWLAVPGRVDGLLETESDRRLYARSAVAAGDSTSASKSGLSTTEITWLRMHASSAASDHKEAARLALHLPVDGYPDKVGVLLAALAHSNWKPTHQEITAIRDLPDMPGVFLVRAASGAALPPGSWDEIRASLSLDPVASETLWIKGLIEGIPTPVDPTQLTVVKEAYEHPYRGLPHDEGLDLARSLSERVVAASYGLALTLSPSEVDELVGSAPSVLDDSVDDGMVSVVGDSSELSVELRGRLAPVTLTDEELQLLGHDWERSRRAYEDGKMPGNALDSPATRHYSALLALRAGDTSQKSAFVDPEGILSAVTDSVDSGVLNVRALSDPTSWQVLDHLVDETHVQQMPGVAGRWYLNRALAAVFSWEWNQTLEAGKEALRYGQGETARDEALNLIAFAQYQLGQDEAAVTALERALEGVYTPSLQANAGVVAEQMAPDRAAFHLGRLAAEAPNNELRLAAVRRAFQVWNQSRPAWEEGGDDVHVPADLLDAMRSLVVLDTPLEDHREIMRLLAYFDSEWVADTSNTQMSPHFETWDHKLYQARANHDPNAYISALASALKAKPDEEWLGDERDGFVASMRSLIFEDIENVGPAAYAYAAIDAGLPMETLDMVTLTFGAVISICRSLTAEKHEPADAVYFHFLVAAEAFEELDSDQQEMIDELLTIAGNSYAVSVAIARNEMLQDGFQALNTLTARLYGIPKHRIKWSAVTESMRPLREMTDDSLRALRTAKPHARNEEVLQGIDEMIGEFTRLRGFAANPRSAF